MKAICNKCKYTEACKECDKYALTNKDMSMYFRVRAYKQRQLDLHPEVAQCKADDYSIIDEQ